MYFRYGLERTLLVLLGLIDNVVKIVGKGCVYDENRKNFCEFIDW